MEEGAISGVVFGDLDGDGLYTPGVDAPLDGVTVTLAGTDIVGNPVANMLVQKQKGGNATLTVCHTRTKDLGHFVRQADIVIAAAHLGHDAVVRRLIAAGAPLDHINNLHWTALIEAIVLGDGGPRHVATLRALVEAGADISIADRNRTTPLQMAQRRGFGEMVRILEARARK